MLQDHSADKGLKPQVPEVVVRLRFVVTWTVLSVIARSSLELSALATPRLLYATLSLFTVVSIVATPIAQGIALRSAGFRWGGEWALATITGAVFASALMHVLRAPHIELLRFDAFAIVIYQIIGAAARLLFQSIVLRRHAAHVRPWVATVALVWATGRVIYWLLTGAWFAEAPSPTLSPIVRLAISSVNPLLEGLVLAWIVLPPADRAALPSVRKPHSGWLWAEWTACATLALLIIMTAARGFESMFRGDPMTGAMLGRPLFAAFVGASIGATQWLLLRRWLAVPPAWIAVSAAALAVPALGIFIPLLGTLVFFAWLMAVQTALGMALVGVWFGACQWFVLRRYAHHAVWWIPATSIGWSMFYLSRHPTNVSFQVIGFAAGAISGLALLPLVKRTANEPVARAEGTGSELRTDGKLPAL